jgi:2Fe-2S ferredoxin
MPRIRFENDDIEAEVPAGTTLSLAAGESGATLGFGCRAGTCGTCALTVEEGAEGIEAKGYVEQDTLQVVGEDGPERRLGCQIIVRDQDLTVSW